MVSERPCSIWSEIYILTCDEMGFRFGEVGDQTCDHLRACRRQMWRQTGVLCGHGSPEMCIDVEYEPYFDQIERRDGIS